jgi:class 3 adenylate cyclase
MPSLLGRLYRKLGARYFSIYVVFEFVSAMVVCLATVGIFSLYTETSAAEFWRLVAVVEGVVVLAVTYAVIREGRLARPIIDWIRAGRPEEDALGVWRCAVAMPRQLVLANGWRAFAIVALPVAVYATIEFDLTPYEGVIVFAGALVAVGYAAILHFFGSDLFMRPVLEDIARHLPPDFGGARLGVPLRWKLLGALPLINVITGVVASGLSTDGSASLDDLGLDVVVAVGVAFTISFELVLLVTRSILRPVDDLLEATEAVKRGDLEARVPVVSGDELGALAGSFNEMMQGLSERERLRMAFGSYVDPEVAERVLEEGELLEGQEREVTVMFVDVCDFTARAEASTARETVAFLNEFFDVVVPCVLEHGGHANKFLGDGVLAVFGAPERLPDHADRAVEAAMSIAGAIGERFGGDVRIGIGISTGPVVVGSVGGGGRLDFSVIGDAVNVAARVQAHTREIGAIVLLTDATIGAMNMRDSGVYAKGEAQLRGIADPVRLYSADTALDERSTLRRKSLITDA